MADIDVSIGADTSDFDKGMKSTKTSLALFVTGVNQAAELATKAFRLIASAVEAPIDAFRESEKASNQLTLALENQGLEAGALSKSYKSMAAALQEKTGVDDDAIVSSLALLQSFIGQQEITPQLAASLVDLAERTGSLESAAEVLGRGIQGNTRGLKQFGISVDETGTSSERLADIMGKLKTRVGGAAEAANQGLGGMRGLRSAVSDLFESVGEQLAPALTEIIGKLREFAIEINKSPDTKDFLKDFGQALVNITGFVIALIDALTKLGKLPGKIGTALEKLLPEQSPEQKARNKAFLDTQDFGGGDPTAALIAKSAKEKSAPVAPPDLSPVIKNAEDASTQLGVIDNEETKRKKREDEARLANRVEFNDAVLSQNEEFQALNKEQQAVFLEENKVELEKAFLTTQEAEAKALKESIKIQTDANNQRLLEQQKFGTAYAAINKALNSEQVKGVSKAAGELVALQKSNNATLKAIGKAAAITQITIATAQSAMNIFNGFSKIPIVGIPLGIAGAAAAVAFGAEQIGTVLAAQKGGIVPGTGSGDIVPAMLEPGELVVPKNSFDSVISAVAEKRSEQNGRSTSVTEQARAGGQFSAVLEFSGDGAEKFLTARQVEARSLGTIRETAA